jgi:hypothetical protein
MAYNTENCWVFALYPSSGVLESGKHIISETVSVFALRFGEEAPTLLGLLMIDVSSF